MGNSLAPMLTYRLTKFHIGHRPGDRLVANLARNPSQGMATYF